MMIDELHDDALLRVLHALPGEDAAPARVARVRARCHADLRRRSRRSSVVTRLGDFWQRVLVPALVTAACAVYLAEVGRCAAAVLGF